MKIKGNEKAICFRAEVLIEKYGITLEKARALKLGEIVDVAADKAKRLLEDDLACPLNADNDEPIISEPNDDN